MSNARGGARPGAGRKALGRKYVQIRLSPEEHEALNTLGGSTWIRRQIHMVQEKKIMTTIDTDDFTDEQQAAFIEGWEEAGGYTGDTDSDAPWCAPWCYHSEIEVTGTDVKDWGRQYWEQCREEVEQLLAEEEKERRREAEEKAEEEAEEEAREARDAEPLYVLQCVNRFAKQYQFFRMTKAEFMEHFDLSTRQNDGDYEIWCGDCLDGVYDCRSKEDALDVLKNLLDGKDISQEDYDELAAEVRAAN